MNYDFTKEEETAICLALEAMIDEVNDSLFSEDIKAAAAVALHKIEASPCTAVIHHGAGHQSMTRCSLKGDGHALHQAEVGGGRALYWKGDEGMSDFFDGSPFDEFGEER